MAGAKLRITQYRSTNGANPRCIHFRPTDQIVQGAHRIPNEVASHALANQQASSFGLEMFISCPSRHNSAQLPAVGLFSFALSYRIECQYNETLHGQIRRDPLRLRLPLLNMAGL